MRGAATLAVLLVLARIALAAELLMVTTPGCPWCLRWEQELGAIYPRSAVGKLLPLRHAEMRGLNETLVLAEPLRYTPTFIVVDRGREVGRITGYGGQDAFWGLLNQLASRIDLTGTKP